MRSFHGGIHPEEKYGGKHITGKLPIRDAAVPEELAISLSQHIGAPCKPLVKPGQRVLLGEKIGEPAGFVGAPVHASVSGVVKAIETRINAAGAPVQAVVIKNDGLDEMASELEPISDPMEATKEVLLARIREAGIVGMGGATFPSQVKFTPPKEKVIDTLILNGAECEPYLTGDHRLMLEAPHAIKDGARIVAKILGAERVKIGIESNKPDGIRAMQAAVQGTDIEICPLKVRYPQGGEKQLVYALTGRKIPSGALPMEVGCVVMNVATAAAVAQAVMQATPVTKRIVTVTGAVREPANLMVRIGTPISALIEECGGAAENAEKIILGGPMMGMAAYDMNVPVMKGTSGILILPAEKKEGRKTSCIRCGRCIEACPMGLMPTKIARYAELEQFDEAARAHAMDCIECGSCAYVCPALLPLTQSIRTAKREILRKSRSRGG